MPFEITITADAERQLRSLPTRDQRILTAAILSRLPSQPTTPTRALRPNPLAQFELRAGDLRALYIMWKVLRSLSSLLDERSATSCSSKARKFMAIKTIPLSRLETDLKQTLSECAESGDTVVVEMPDQRLLTIQSLDPQQDDSLADELLASNPAFRALIEKSKAGPRKPFIDPSTAPRRG